ncbi:MAG: hypothetical protein H7338_17880 [Candidatus Sericytochromatia bacterium]|nr:hypothetical protein [Candidatus Sericytochromatia bacterium]
MSYRYLVITLLLAGCNAPMTTPFPATPLTFRTDAVTSSPARAMSYAILAEGAATEQPEVTISQYRSPEELRAVWQSLPFYAVKEILPTHQLQRLDFAKESVYLIGIPYAYMTDDPKIIFIAEGNDEIVVNYRTVQRGAVSLPATKTHFLAIALKASDKQVRLNWVTAE